MADNTINRNNGVTIAKAIAIILMVLGHSGCPDELNHLLGLMRMPLFFLMSGYCFKSKYLVDGNKYLKRRFVGIYIPCVKWSIVFLLMHNLFCYIGLYNVEFGANPKSAEPYSISIIAHQCATLVLALVPNEELIGGFWFLHDLFFGSILFYFALQLLKRTYITIPLLLVLTIAMSYFDIALYYFFYPRTVLASCFITIGYAYKEYKFRFEKSWTYILITLVLTTVVSTHWYSNFLEFSWEDVVPYTFFAVLGSLMIFGIGEKMNAMRECSVKSLLVFTGSKTFNVLTWHMISFKLVSLLIIVVYGLPWKRIAEFPIINDYARNGWFFVYFLVGVIVPIFWSYVYDRWKTNKN